MIPAICNPECEDRCQLMEHKGYDTCHQSGECSFLGETERRSETFNQFVKRMEADLS